MERAARQKILAVGVVLVGALAAGRIFPSVLGTKERVTLRCQLAATTADRRVDLTLQSAGKTVRTLSIPVPAHQDAALPAVDLRPGSYEVHAVTQSAGRVLTAHAVFDVPGGAPVLMLAAPPEVNP